MTEEEALQLKKENQELREALQQTQELLRVALARIEELEKQKTPPPAFVKANVQKKAAEEKKVRKKRDAKDNHARQRSQPTQIVEHRIVSCPDCHQRLGGISLARLREVIDVPPPPPVEITQHRIFKGWCSGCQKWYEAPVDFHEQVLGQGRLGVRIASLIACLRTVMRLPFRQIQASVLTIHGLQISLGEVVEVLHRLREHAQPVLDAFKAEIRASPAVQADETGWREDGNNGYIWSISTPTLRY
jgi:transposase